MGTFLLEKEQFIGLNTISFNGRDIEFPSPLRDIEIFSEQYQPKIVLLYHYAHNNVKPYDINNIHCYDPSGSVLWTIKDLVPEYNNINTQNFGINNYFTKIKKLDFNILYAYSDECHFYVNVPKGKLVYIEGHR